MQAWLELEQSGAGEILTIPNCHEPPCIPPLKTLCKLIKRQNHHSENQTGFQPLHLHPLKTSFKINLIEPMPCCGVHVKLMRSLSTTLLQ
jgi:hypothetical protein